LGTQKVLDECNSLHTTQTTNRVPQTVESTKQDLTNGDF